MAKYVLLAFDSDKDVDAFVEYVQTAKFVCALPGEYGTYTDLAIFDDVTVRGVWKKPTQFCSCIGGKNRGWTRGKKFGWWVCSLCHKPAEAWARGDAWYTALGVNLLPVSPDAPEYRGPESIQAKNARVGGPLPEMLKSDNG